MVEFRSRSVAKTLANWDDDLVETLLFYAARKLWWVAKEITAQSTYFNRDSLKTGLTREVIVIALRKTSNLSVPCLVQCLPHVNFTSKLHWR